MVKRQPIINIATYSLAIIIVNVIFLWIRHLASAKERTWVMNMHIFLGILQLIYTIPKIISEVKKIK